MCKFILSAALLAFSVTALPQAHAANPSGWFVNAGVASNHSTFDSGGFSYNDTTAGSMFNVGWRKGVLGVEAGYTDLGSETYNFGGSCINGSGCYGGSSLKISAHGFTTGLNLHYNINDKFFAGGRAGAFFWTAREDSFISFGPGSGSYNTSSTGWYAGVGAGYSFTPNWSAAVNYNHYDMNKSGGNVKSDLYGVTLEYSF